MANTPHHAVRVPHEVWRAAKARAHREGRSLTSVIVEFLHRYVSGPCDCGCHQGLPPNYGGCGCDSCTWP